MKQQRMQRTRRSVWRRTSTKPARRPPRSSRTCDRSLADNAEAAVAARGGAEDPRGARGRERVVRRNRALDRLRPGARGAHPEDREQRAVLSRQQADHERARRRFAARLADGAQRRAVVSPRSRCSSATAASPCARPRRDLAAQRAHRRARAHARARAHQAQSGRRVPRGPAARGRQAYIFDARSGQDRAAARSEAAFQSVVDEWHPRLGAP